MKNHFVIAILAVALFAGPSAVRAQEEPASAPAAIDAGLLEALCSAVATDDIGQATCLLAVAVILSGQTGAVTMDAEASPGPQDLLAQARAALDDALAGAQEGDVASVIDAAVAAAGDVEVQSALESALAAAQDVDVQDVDVQAALDEAIAATSEIDLEAALADVMMAAQEVDLQAAVDLALDEALAAAGEVDVDALLDESVQTTRRVIGAAQVWVQDNSDAVCKGGSLSVGTATGAVVAYLTGSPGLAIRAFEESERLSNDLCGDIAQ